MLLTPTLTNKKINNIFFKNKWRLWTPKDIHISREKKKVAVPNANLKFKKTMDEEVCRTGMGMNFDRAH